MSVLFSGDLTPDQFHRCLAGLNWPVDTLVLACAEDAFRFATFNGPDEFLARTDQGRVFHPQGECRWRRLPASGYPENQVDGTSLVRLVFLGQEQAFERDGLEDASALLHGLTRAEQTRYLWGIRTDLEPEWIEQQVPHRFVYPVASARHSRGRIRLVLEEWQGQDGEPVFSRFHHIEETQGEKNHAHQ